MSLRAAEARRAGVASTRSEAQCAIEGRKAAGGARTRPKGVRSAGTPRRREGGQMPTRPRQFGGRSPEICRAVPARRQRRVRGRNRRGRCEDTEHRAAEGEHGAKTRIDYAELRSSRSLRHGLRRATSLFPSGKRRLLGSAASYGSATIQKAPLFQRGRTKRARCARSSAK